MKRTTMIKAIVAGAAVSTLVACGGGGSSGGGGHYNPGPIITYPFETVFGEVCTTSTPTPGCTFNRDGTRVTIDQDANYNRYGYGSDDLYYVVFDGSGYGAVYDDLGRFMYSRHVSQFDGFISGTTIGVGNTGLFWENVSYGTYWIGRNGVLYSANPNDPNFGEAINNDEASDAADTNFAALNSEANQALIKAASDKLVADYGFQADKARAVASALNSWAISSAERGFTTDKDMDQTFKSVFGVEFKSTLAAVKGLQLGDKSGMREVTDRSAAALGLKPHQAQKFIKGMYKQALAEWGYDVDQVSW